MNRIRRLLPVLVALTLLGLAAVPVAGARGLETPRIAIGAAEPGWLGAAVQWLEDLFGAHRPAGISRDRSGSQATQKDVGGGEGGGGESTTGGPCIDPMGIPRPGCADS